VQTIKDWLGQEGGTNTFEILNEVDQFFVSITDKVPHFEKRLKCWKFTLKFDEDNNNVAAELLRVQRGLKAVRYSKGFAKVLEITLAIGNFMNYGTRTGSTVAFDIADLIKLAESPANDRSAGNLVDFLIKTLEAKYPEHTQWTKELAEVKTTKEASWEKIDLGMKEIQSQLTQVKVLAKEITSAGPKDKFSTISAKITKAEQEFEPTKSLLEGVERDWQNVAKLFAKDPATIKPEAFCGLIWEFVVKYNNTVDERAKREEAAQKAKARADIEAKKDSLSKRKAELEQTKHTREGSATDSAPISARGEKSEPASPSSSAMTTPRTTSPSPSSSTPTSPVKTAAAPPEKEEEIQVDAVLQEFEKAPAAQTTIAAPVRRNSGVKDGLSAAEKRKLLEEKRKKLAAAKAAKNKS